MNANPRQAFLSDPSLAAGLRRFVRARAPLAEVDDIVQSTLADALASHTAPHEGAELQPWLYGIARNKIADVFRRARREAGREPLPAEELAVADSVQPASTRDLLRWAERELPAGEGSQSTLEWMLREGDGEKLETIAAEENVPAPRVRQRVARLRRHFRARWAAQLAAAAVIAVVLALLVAQLLHKNDIARPEPPAPPPTMQAPPPAPLAPAPAPENDLRPANDTQPTPPPADTAPAIDGGTAKTVAPPRSTSTTTTPAAAADKSLMTKSGATPVGTDWSTPPAPPANTSSATPAPRPPLAMPPSQFTSQSNR
jgi:DNA-directed RNA polymerase specialized sigma24 family protein